ncbi:MAG: HAD hydrolase-like protein [Nitrosomonas sp.]|nr:HAD hydrolase-like protein [Nitrosomonas sp.]
MKATDWQAIIFDFDGVVAESGKIKTQAFAALYESYGDKIVAAVVQHHNQNGGMSRYRKFHYYQQHFLDKPTLTADEEKELDRRFSELVVEAVIACDAVPGANELIRQQAKRIPLFVASGTPEIELKVIVERRDLSPYFKEVRGAPTLKQTLVAEIVAKHHLNPASTLMIGDALVDYESADENGLAFLGRVCPGDPNPFPEHVRVVSDLRGLVS